jgi:hypothetical protein
MALLRGEHFFPLNRSYGVKKNREFYADFKNGKFTLVTKCPPPPKKKEVKIKKRKNWDFAKL